MFNSKRQTLLEPVAKGLPIYCTNLVVAITVVSSWDHLHCCLKCELFSLVLMFKVILKKPNLFLWGRLFQKHPV